MQDAVVVADTEVAHFAADFFVRIVGMNQRVYEPLKCGKNTSAPAVV
jgi:hypothetical protein